MITQIRQLNIRWHTLFVVLAAIILLLVLPSISSDFQISLLGRFLTYAIAGLGLDLLWGYTGMLSLGQGLFFGLGAYCFAMYLNLETAGVRLPEFMGLYGVTELPALWQPFHSPVIAIAIIFPMVIAGVIGFMIFRSRVQGVYFSIITQALTAIVALLLVGQQRLINGTNGITEMRTVFSAPIRAHDTTIGLYIATVLVMGVVYLGCRALVRSRFGRLLVAVRDDENRLRFIGYNPVVIKTLVFMLSAGIAGLAGVLFVPQVGIISPKQLDIVASIEIVIWVAVGGRGTLIGPIVGALLVNTGKSTISTAYPDLWQLIMGGLFVGVVLLFPKGLVGSLQSFVTRFIPQSVSPQPPSSDDSLKEIKSVH